LEIHSSDLGGYSYRHSDYPRCAKLHVGELKIVRKLTKLRKFFAEAHQAKAGRRTHVFLQGKSFSPCGEKSMRNAFSLPL
jgi:hypothetical protein